MPYVGDATPPTPQLVTLSLVLLNLAVFGVVAAATWRLGPDLPVRWFAALGLSPGALRWHTLLTYWLLHEHLLHLSANMLCLFVFGSAVERAMGSWRFAVLFLVAAAATGLIEAGAVIYGPARETDVMIIGSSGPAACVLGVFSACFYPARLRVGGTRLSLPIIPIVLTMAAGEMVSIAIYTMRAGGPIAPSAAHWAHIGGFLLGIVYAHASGMVRASQRTYRRRAVCAEAKQLSPFAAVERWEAAVAADPDNHDALFGWIEALLDTGDAERAIIESAAPITQALKDRRTDDALRLYRILGDRGSDIIGRLSTEDAMAIAGALAQNGDADRAVALYDALADRETDPTASRTARIRATVCVLRHQGWTPRAEARLQAFLAGDTDPGAKAYLERLAAEARARPPAE